MLLQNCFLSFYCHVSRSLLLFRSIFAAMSSICCYIMPLCGANHEGGSAPHATTLFSYVGIWSATKSLNFLPLSREYFASWSCTFFSPSNRLIVAFEIFSLIRYDLYVSFLVLNLPLKRIPQWSSDSSSTTFVFYLSISIPLSM
jgi:hypothetical protein